MSDQLPSAPSPSGIDRHGPTLLVVVGIGMVGVGAVGYLADAVSTAFAIIGAGLLVIGSLAERIIAVKLTASGFEATLAARQALAIAEGEAESEGDPEQAEAFKRAGEVLDEWFIDYLNSPERRDPMSTPNARAAAMARAYRARKGQAASNRPPEGDLT